MVCEVPTCIWRASQDLNDPSCLNFGDCLVGVWRVFENYLVGVWWMSGRCLEGVLTVFGRCLEGVWIVYTWYWNGNLLSQDRSSQSGQIKAWQVKSGQVKSGQVKQDRSSQDWSSQDRSSQSTVLVLSGRVNSGKRETALVDHCGYNKPEEKLFLS